MALVEHSLRPREYGPLMAKSPKSTKPRKPARAPTGPLASLGLNPALRATALRAGGAAAILGLGVGLYAFHGQHAQMASAQAPVKLAAVAPRPASSPVAP